MTETETLTNKVKRFKVNTAEIKPVLKSSISLIVVCLATFVLQNLSMIQLGGMEAVMIPVATVMLETIIRSFKQGGEDEEQESEPLQTDIPPSGDRLNE